MRRSHSFSYIYHTMLQDALKRPELELIGETFQLTIPSLNTVNSDLRDFNELYAEAYFQWIMAGESDPAALEKYKPGVSKFVEMEGRNTAYGPRIVAQLPELLDELRAEPYSRRATIMILDSDDQVLLPSKRAGRTQAEFPCAMGFAFFSRPHDERLNLHVTMRSNNLVHTICYDVFIFTKILRAVADKLDKAVGHYYHHMISGHILKKDEELATRIVAMWNAQ